MSQYIIPSNPIPYIKSGKEVKLYAVYSLKTNTILNYTLYTAIGSARSYATKRGLAYDEHVIIEYQLNDIKRHGITKTV